jgi:facilitated trehalose transporter
MFFQVATGIDAIIFFCYEIFQESGTNISPNLSSITIGVVQVVGMLGAAFVIDRLGRRLLLLVSEIAVIISLASLGLFFYLSKYDAELRTTLGWLPLGSLMLFAVGFSIGLGPVPWIYLEIMPTHVAGTELFCICN